MFRMLRNPKTLLLIAVFCVFATYNPLKISLYHWISQGHWDTQWLWYGLSSLVLLGIWIFLLDSIKKSCSAIGLGLIILILAGIGYIPYHTGFLSGVTEITIWLAQILLAIGLWFCASWARIRRALNGQASVDTVDGDSISIEN